MKNLEQIRAKNALQALKTRPALNKGQDGGDALTGFPAMIIENGLLAAIAFSISKSKKETESGQKLICDAIADHLGDPEIGLLPKEYDGAEGLRNMLISSDSTVLRLSTAEAIKFLNYLRRFAKAKG